MAESTADTGTEYMILVVEENASCLGFYDADTGEDIGRIALSLWPHEIAVSSDGRAYVSNFGIRDYDLSLGRAGNSVSIVDIKSRCEVGRYTTRAGNACYWGPHGVKLSPDEQHVYVNVERVMGVREPDLARPGQESTKLLKFSRSTGKLVHETPVSLLDVPGSGASSERIANPLAAYDVAPGTHNFVFSPDVSNELWMFSGRGGVAVVDVDTGRVLDRMTCFNGAVRALSFGKSGLLLVSATNEVSVVDPKRRSVVQRFSNLGVSQLLYSKFTPDEAHVLAPAVWEGQLIVIDCSSGKVIHRLATGIDPVQVMISPDDKRAYITHGRSEWLSYVDLRDLSKVSGKIKTKGGPNGVSFAPRSARPKRRRLVLAACLPLTGRYAPEGRELRLGYQFWQDTVNDSGGLLISGEPHEVDIVYSDTESTTDEKRLKALVGDLLLGEPGILAILGSYPSSANALLGMAASKEDVPFVSGLRADEHSCGAGAPLAFSLAAPARSVFDGVLQALRHGVTPKPVTVCILATKEDQHLEAGRATAKFAKTLGFVVLSLGTEAGEPVLYVAGQDPSALLASVRDLAPDILLVVGDRDDAVEIVRCCSALKFSPGALAVSCGITAAGFRDRVGAHAEGLLGCVEWTEGLLHYSEDRFGCGPDYAARYFDEFSEPASAFAASASAAGVVLEQVVQAGASSRRAVAEALQHVHFDSFFGPVGFGAERQNVRKEAYTVQLVREGAKFLEAPVWPRAAARGRVRWPRLLVRCAAREPWRRTRGDGARPRPLER